MYMRRDPKQFRERFQRWKNGEQVYDAGLPKYEMGKDDEAIHYETEQPAQYYYPEDKDLISRVANTLTDSKGNILERTLPELTVTAPRRGLFGRRTPSSSYVRSMSDEAVDREGRQQSTLNNSIRAAQNKAGHGALEAAELAATFSPFAPAVFGGNLISRAHNQGWGMFKDPMTYLDATGVIAPALQYIRLPKLNFRGPDGKIFNSQMQYNPRNWYRGVGKNAIVDANQTGVIRGSDPSVQIGEGSGPWFGRGRPGMSFHNYIIEGNPEQVDFIDALKYQKGIKEILPIKPTTAIGETSIYDTPFEYGKEGFPINVNTTPASNFTYYKKHPLFGWRQKQFKPNK